MAWVQVRAIKKCVVLHNLKLNTLYDLTEYSGLSGFNNPVIMISVTDYEATLNLTGANDVSNLKNTITFGNIWPNPDTNTRGFSYMCRSTNFNFEVTYTFQMKPQSNKGSFITFHSGGLRDIRDDSVRLSCFIIEKS